MNTASPEVLSEFHNGVLRVRMNRPEKKNALNHAMYTGLADALARAEATDAIRVVLLTGSDTCFTAGNDLSDFMAAPPVGAETPVGRFLAGISRARKPIVAGVCGPAVGIGTTMLLHCDLVYAARDARFHMPFVNLGLCPEAASSLLLPRLVGYPRAAELLLLGEAFDGQQAREMGVVNEALSAPEVLDRALAVAERLACLPPESVRITKELMRRATAGSVAETIEREGRLFHERLASPEAKEAFSAFMERRAPDFSKFT